MLATLHWNRNRVYSSVTPTLAMLCRRERHIVNQALVCWSQLFNDSLQYYVVYTFIHFYTVCSNIKSIPTIDNVLTPLSCEVVQTLARLWGWSVPMCRSWTRMWWPTPDYLVVEMWVTRPEQSTLINIWRAIYCECCRNWRKKHGITVWCAVDCKIEDEEVNSKCFVILRISTLNETCTMTTYLTRHTVLSDIYILLVASAEVSLVLDSLVVDHECTGNTVYQLYTGRVHHRTRATCDRGCTADRSHWWGDTPPLEEVVEWYSSRCCSDIVLW